MEEREAVEDTILFSTPELRSEDVSNNLLVKELIFKPNNKEWNFLYVQLLLNNLSDFKMSDRPRFYQKEPKYFTMTFALNNDEKKTIRFTYYYDSKNIEMKASTKLVLENWTKQVTTKMTKVGTHNRILSTPVKRDLVTFILSINTENDSSKAIISERNPIFYTIEDFSDAYCSFIRYFRRFWNDDIANDMRFGIDFYDLWYVSSKIDPRITRRIFFEENEGYVEFIVNKRQHKNSEAFIIYEGEEYVIKKGIYISPFAESICSKENENIVHGVILDTTWRTLPDFVTSIIMASVCNVGIPMGFSFGPCENKDIYKVFYDKFSSVINVDLTKYVIESDRGSALKALSKEIGIEHLSCNVHFLRSLKTSEFSYQIGELVSAKCQIDLDILMDHYSKEFCKFIGTEKIENLNKALMSCGLIFDINSKKISINNMNLWEHISLNCRAKYKMPTTTNALEASHGHLNARIPRHNDFYTAMNRLIRFIITKTHNFDVAYKSNLNRARRVIQRKCSSFYTSLLEKESKQYESTKEKCNCGETIILSEMMLVDIPCSHRMHKGAVFPKKPYDLTLKLKNSFEKLIVHLVVDEKVAESTEDNYEKYINRKAAATVRKFCKEKNLENIRNALEPFSLNDTEVFANGKPISFYECVSSGIHRFYEVQPEILLTSSDKMSEEVDKSN